ncbi:hypothetical protein CALVIDRAFT_422270 [Calocera viscosa TUFC12733]|uniref:C2H2-type domain-containing protein n=1 Tax=Calocera viscosa (strain TUFC12733) TaxID=1330018 RepID=A0A167PJU0_CALVF|nr:hypothetical protein CALVIDRAFT_422270 [Calocera viscosa TUFC12733]
MTTFWIKSSYGVVSILNDSPDDPGRPPISGALGTAGARTHPPSGSPRRQCPVCSKIFSCSGHLTRHLTVHTGAKRFECPSQDCHKRCSRQDNLTQHYRMHLPGHLAQEKSCVVRRLLDEMRAQRDEDRTGETQEEDSHQTTSNGDPTLRNHRGVPNSPTLCSSPEMFASDKEVVLCGRMPHSHCGSHSTSPSSTASRIPSTADMSGDVFDTLPRASSSSSMSTPSTTHPCSKSSDTRTLAMLTMRESESTWEGLETPLTTRFEQVALSFRLSYARVE